MARKYRNSDNDYGDYDDRPRRKSGGWYGTFLLLILLIIASVVGFLVYRTYEMLTTDEKAVYTSPVLQQKQATTGNADVAVLSPSGQDAVTPSAEEFSVTPSVQVEQLNPEQEVYAPPEENVESTQSPIDPTNRRFDQELDNLF